MKKPAKLYRAWAVVSKKGQVYGLYLASNKRLALHDARFMGENWKVIQLYFNPVRI